MPEAHHANKPINLAACFGVLLVSAFAGHNVAAAQAFNEDSLLLQLSGDDALISIATGTPRPVVAAPAVTTVITEEDIRESGALSLSQLLEYVPGLHTVTSNAKLQSPTYSIRGINTQQGPHTLFLVNGKEITYLLTGALATGLEFPLEGIKRIEVIRGPGSAIYGADAFAGVVNIIYKTGKEINATRAGLKTGSFKRNHAWAQYGGEIAKGWSLAANIEYSQSRGDNDRIIDSDAQSALDAVFATSASLAPGPLNTHFESLVSSFTLNKNEWTLHFNSWNRKLGTGAGFGNALDPTGFSHHDQYLFDINYDNKQWADNWQLKASFSQHYLDSIADLNIFPAGTLLPIGSDGNLDLVTPAGLVLFTDGVIGQPGRRENTSHFDLTGIYSGWSRHVLRLNTGYKKEESSGTSKQNFGPSIIDGTVSPVDGTLTNISGTPFIYIPNSDRTVHYVSVQDEWQFSPDWTLTAGIRYDNYSDFGSTTNPRLSLVWNARHDLTTKLLYGRAFRAPSFTELYTQNNPVVLGNPELDPETIDTFELVFDYHPAPGLKGVLNLFHYDIDGLIDFVDDDGLPGGNTRAQNNSDIRANGYEVEFTWQATNKFRLAGDFAYQDSSDRQTGESIAGTPRKQAHLSANWRFAPHWSSQLDVFRIMDRKRDRSDPRDAVDDYTLVNLAVNGRQVIGDFDLQIGIRNLFDTTAYEPGPVTVPGDYPLESRNAFIGISGEF